MRIWLDKDKLAAFALTAADVEKALRRENVELPAGVIESVDRQFTLRVNRQFTSADEFASLVVRADNQGLVRLGMSPRWKKAQWNTAIYFAATAPIWWA